MYFSPPPYLDPGSGSIIIQVLIASLLAAGVALRASWSKIQGFFGRKSKPADQDDDHAAA
jgi:hypothetical protein